jgi:hypothetical protein
VKDGIITQKSEIDEGKALIHKMPQTTLTGGLSIPPANPC